MDREEKKIKKTPKVLIESPTIIVIFLAVLFFTMLLTFSLGRNDAKEARLKEISSIKTELLQQDRAMQKILIELETIESSITNMTKDILNNHLSVEERKRLLLRFEEVCQEKGIKIEVCDDVASKKLEIFRKLIEMKLTKEECLEYFGVEEI